MRTTEPSNGHLIALDSDAALNAAWARRAGMVSYLPRSVRVAARLRGRIHRARFVQCDVCFDTMSQHMRWRPEWADGAAGARQGGDLAERRP